MAEQDTVDITDRVLLEIVSFAVGENMRNAQSLSRWLSAGTGIALGVVIPLIVAGKAILPQVAHFGVVLLILCFIPAVIAEWLALPLLSIASGSSKASEILKRVLEEASQGGRKTPTLNGEAMFRVITEAAPWPIRNTLRRYMQPYDAKGLALWYGRRANKVRTCVLGMATGVPIAIALLSWAFLGPSICGVA